MKKYFNPVIWLFIFSVFNFENGKKEGESVWYNEDGKPYQVTWYENDMKEGVQKNITGQDGFLVKFLFSLKRGKLLQYRSRSGQRPERG